MEHTAGNAYRPRSRNWQVMAQNRDVGKAFAQGELDLS